MLLKGIRVLDLSRVLAGPLAGMILGDLGAEVIKVEPPGGDETRSWAPFVDDESVYFMSINRSKRSIVINLKKEEGREVLYRLVKKSDVVIENFRPGVPESLGVDYESLKRIKRDIIYCSIKGFGSKSPYRDKPAYDLILQAMSGLMLATGEEGGEPVRVAFALFDVIAGLIAVNSILAALLERSKSGVGRHIEISLYDCALFGMCYIPMIYLMTKRTPARFGSGHPSIVPYQAFRCRDGKFIAVAITNERFWAKLCNALGLKHLKEDPRFRSNPERVRNRDALIPILEEVFASRDRDQWISILESAGVPYGPVYNLEEVFNDPHVVESKIVSMMVHAKLGEIPQLLYPVLFDGERVMPKIPPPLKGCDSISILKELGYNEAEISRLLREGIICCEC